MGWVEGASVHVWCIEVNWVKAVATTSAEPLALPDLQPSADYSTLRHGVVLCGMVVWYGVVWYGGVVLVWWCAVVSHGSGVVWCGVVWWCAVVSYGGG